MPNLPDDVGDVVQEAFEEGWAEGYDAGYDHGYGDGLAERNYMDSSQYQRIKDQLNQEEETE